MKTNFTSRAQNNRINLPPISDIFFPDDRLSHSFVIVYKFIIAANKGALWVEMIKWFLHSSKSRDEL